MTSSFLVPFILGSPSDLPHAHKIQTILEKTWHLDTVIRISSAHKAPRALLSLLQHYENDDRVLAYVTIAGRSNALSALVDGSVCRPVIACPPLEAKNIHYDIYSSIRLPSGVAPLLVLEPVNAALAVAKLAAGKDPLFEERIRQFQSRQRQRLHIEDIKQLYVGYQDFISQEQGVRQCNVIDKNSATEIHGKVRDIFRQKERIIFVTSDRLSAMDLSVGVVPWKGIVLNQVNNWWMKQLEKTSIIPHHLHPSHEEIIQHCPRVMVAYHCRPFLIEFVVRGYITGSSPTSLWTHYNQGVRHYCGHYFPDGLVKNEKLAQPVVTPTTKDVHDELISGDDIVNRNIMTREEWEYCHQKSLELFTWGQRLSEEHGLILVDTKYEFGRDSQGTIRLIDEIHTPDSSRFWLSHAYDECFQKGQEPDNINKEFIRIWLKQQKERLGEYPEVPSDQLAQLAIRYFQLYHLITGKEFELTPLTTGEITLPPSYNDDSSIHLILT